MAALVGTVVPVVVVHAHRFPSPGEMHPSAALRPAGRPTPRPLLRHTHQHDAGRRREALAILLDEVILPFALPELNPRDVPGITPGPQSFPEGRRDLVKDFRRGNDGAPAWRKKATTPPR